MSSFLPFGLTWGDVIGGATALYGATRPTPDAPNYGKLAQQQGDINLQAALQEAQLNRVNETNPYGSLTYGRTADPNAPGGYTYTRNIQLSPEQQQLYNLESGNQIAGQRIASGLQSGIADAVSTPFSLNSFGKPIGFGDASSYAGGADKVRDALYQQATALRQPQMERDKTGLDTQLRNQGLMPGTEAYDHSLQQLREQQGQELNDLSYRAILAGGQEQSRLGGLDLALGGANNQNRSQGIQEALLQRQQPLSEFNAFRTGNTPALPQFQPYGMSQIQPTQAYNAAKDQYAGAINQFNAQQGQLQSLMNFGANYFGKRP